MKRLFVSAKVERRIAALEKGGKSGKTLAHKVSGIIDSLASGNVRNHMEAADNYTKYGEKRIKNCRKYDLGCGYRLITVQRGKTVFIPFLGSHDECQRWLENNSRLKTFNAGKGHDIEIAMSSPTDHIDEDYVNEDMDFDDFLQNLTDRDLRIVFRGLVEGAAKGSE